MAVVIAFLLLEVGLAEATSRNCENIFSKETYNLFNFTSDSTETIYETYQTTTRTSKIAGFAQNPIFVVHTSLMRLIPAVMASIDPELYQQAKDHLLDMNYADYFYITAYPEYSGYRIEHDPTITAYCNIVAEEPLPKDHTPLGGIGALILISIGVALLVILAVVLRRKNNSESKRIST